MSLRELLWAAEARRRHDWRRTALLASVMAEPHRDRRRHPRPFTADDFDPTAARPAGKKRMSWARLRGAILAAGGREFDIPKSGRPRDRGRRK